MILKKNQDYHKNSFKLFQLVNLVKNKRKVQTKNGATAETSPPPPGILHLTRNHLTQLHQKNLKPEEKKRDDAESTENTVNINNIYEFAYFGSSSP